MSVSAAVSIPSPCLHRNPPATPIGFFASQRALAPTVGAAFVALGLAGAISNAWLLLRWDRPMQGLVEGSRTSLLDTLFRALSFFGSTMVVLALGAVLAALAWRRCGAVSTAIIVATLSRPALEFVLKEIVGRARPSSNRMVDGTGYSFPSGHVLAAVAVWGLLPLVVGLFTRSRVLWWVSVGFATFMTVGIAASRVYLGVHWVSDVVAGLLLGSLFLIAIDLVFGRTHGLIGCRRAAPPATPLALLRGEECGELPPK